MRARLARKVLAGRSWASGAKLPRARHLAKGTAIEVLRQRVDDGRVEIALTDQRDAHTYLVPADAIDPDTARTMSIQRAPRHRRASGGWRVPVDWQPCDD